MANYNYGAGDEESAELRSLNAEVREDPDSFEVWEKLVRAAEGLEGGLSRNSSAQSISSARDVYDRFLAKFPLFFGYWKKYADLEFSIAGTEAAELIYERGIASVTNSVDLWAQYCAFKVETSHDPDFIRDGLWELVENTVCFLFERAADSVGLDFLSHIFWDKYLEFEERSESPDRVFAILSRLIHIPMHQYARYFEKFRNLAGSQPVSELASAETVAQMRAEIEMENSQNPKGPAEVEKELRTRLDNHHMEQFQQTQAETTKRWTYEQEIKRPYFHVTELDDSQLVNWRKYLDFEESQHDYKRTAFLYERCLVAAAYYDEFWLRFARWMSSQSNKTEEVRNIYQRAACIYTPISRPEVRLQWALFEEMNDRVGVAYLIYQAMLDVLPGHVETVQAWANAKRRHVGLDAAVDVYQTKSEKVDGATQAALVAERARLLWKVKGAPDEARQVFIDSQSTNDSSPAFWMSYLAFEIDQIGNANSNAEQHQRVKQVYENIVQKKSQLSEEAVKELAHSYQVYLLERGTKDAAKEFLAIDREMNSTRPSDAMEDVVMTNNHFKHES